MKTTLLAFAALAFVTVSASAASVGVVDMEIIKNEYAKAKDYEKKIKADIERVRGEIGQQVEKLKALESAAKAADAAYTKAKDDPMLKEDAKLAKKAEAQAKIDDFMREQKNVQQRDQEAGRYMQSAMKAIDAEIMGDIRAKSEQVAKARKLELVVPKGVALYADASLDISKEVVAKLNETYAQNPVAPGTPITAPAPGSVTPTPAANAAK